MKIHLCVQLREQQHKNEYSRSSESITVEWNEFCDVNQMWEEEKWTEVKSIREICGSVRVGRKNSKSEW